MNGWTLRGAAFTYQPTLGDNPTARNRGMPAEQEGSYWIGGYENYTSSSDSPGSVTGDGLTGTMTSIVFEIKTNKITFLISGGNLPGISFRLIDAETKMILKAATGYNHETLKRQQWDTSSLKGRMAYI